MSEFAIAEHVIQALRKLRDGVIAKIEISKTSDGYVVKEVTPET